MITKYSKTKLFLLYSFDIFKKAMHTQPEELLKIRNIALLAHIDAGKTTTTERLLYSSGKISNMGEVHDGNTVTDFMELERNRGISIASTFVTFNWNKHTFNLVDTPGHIDFTMEVEQCLKIIDGAVIILDGSAGVEAQTITVWDQLIRINLPAIFYVNKMDRKDADFTKCVAMLKEKLSLHPLPIHLPLKDDKFYGIINVVTMQEILWSKNLKKFLINELNEAHELYVDAINIRSDLVDILSTLDDTLANLVLEKESLDAINKNDILSAIRRVTIARKGYPIICGSSFKNIGIEPLLDGIIDFLPSPNESVQAYLHDLCDGMLLARCFKIAHNKYRGPLSHFRIFSGQLQKGQKIYNVNQNNTETVGRLLHIFANELKETPNEKYGNFVAVSGLKNIISGDLISDTGNSAANIKSKIASKLQISEELVAQNIFGNNNNIPEPVFFCSVEPSSQQNELDKALQELQKEDPSLKVKFNSEAGQTVLAGMGELHIDIIKEKLRTFYGLDVNMGPLQIIYKEEIMSPSKEAYIYKNLAGTQEFTVNITISLEKGEKSNILSLDKTADSAENLAHCTRKQVAAIKSGIISAFNNGPLYSCQVVNVHAILHWLEIRNSTPETFLIAAASQCVTKILEKSCTQLLEPFMLLNIIIDEVYYKNVLSDLNKRRAIIINLYTTSSKMQEIKCEAPLSELLGYAKHLRTITSGTAIFNMKFFEYRKMTPQAQAQVLKNNVLIK